MNADNIPLMPGWISTARAAVILGTDKQIVFYKIFKSKQLTQVYRIAGGNDDARPFYVVSEEEVIALAAAEQAAAEQASITGTAKRAVQQRNKRIKDWGIRTGWDGPIHPSGGPSAQLVAAYLQSHPDDVTSE